MLHSEPGQLEPTQPAFEESQRKKGQGTLEVERFFGELVQREREQENQSQHRATAQESESYQQSGVAIGRNGVPVETLSAPHPLPHAATPFHNDYAYPPSALVKPLLNLDLSANMLQSNQFVASLPDTTVFASTVEFNPLLGTASGVRRVRAAHHLIPRRQRSTSEGDIFGYAAGQQNVLLAPKPTPINHGGILISPAGYNAAEVLGFGYRPDEHHQSFPLRSQIPTPISQPSFQHFRPHYYSSQHAQSTSTLPQPLPSTSTLIPATTNSTSNNWFPIDSATDAAPQFFAEPEEHDLSPAGQENYTPRAEYGERETSTADAEGEEDDDDVYSMRDSAAVQNGRNGGGLEHLVGSSGNVVRNLGITPASLLASSSILPPIRQALTPNASIETAFPARGYDFGNGSDLGANQADQVASTSSRRVDRPKRPRDDASSAEYSPGVVLPEHPLASSSTAPLISPPLPYDSAASDSSSLPTKGRPKSRVRGRPRDEAGIMFLTAEAKRDLKSSKESKTTEATLKASEKRRKAGSVARFVCELCGESFTRKYNLKGHLNAHLNKRPFACTDPGCKKAFSRKHDLTRHLLLHAKRSGSPVAARSTSTRKSAGASSARRGATDSDLDAEGEDDDEDASQDTQREGKRSRIGMKAEDEDGEYDDE